jgi:mycothiol maleylpyruvate isomerase-like protein
MADQDAATLYRGTRERVTAAATVLTDEQLAAPVPACPLWTVRDLLGHFAGATADLVSGNLDGAPGPAWTAAHIQARAGLDVAELLAEWTSDGAELERRLRAGEMAGFLPNHPFLDTGMHEADLHGAVGSGRGDPAVWLRTAQMFSAGVSRTLGDTATLTVRTQDGVFTMGTGGAHTTVDTETYELFRAFGGRRSKDQIAQWDWHGPAGDHPAVLAVLDQTPSDLSD